MDIKRLSWRDRKRSLNAGQLTLLGMAGGGLVGLLIPLAPPLTLAPADHYTVREVLTLALALALLGGTGAYLAFLLDDPAREPRFHRVMGLLLFLAIFGSVVFFPKLWWVVFSRGSWMGGMLLGFVCGAVMFVTAAGFGVAHLFEYLSGRLALPRPPGKPRDGAAAAGVWDRDLDRS